MARKPRKAAPAKTGELKMSAQQRYDTLVPDREPFLRRARDCAVVTIPSVMPPQGFGPSQTLPTPYQSLGARGVRTLASKLLLSLFPNGTPFFQYKIDDQDLQALGQNRGPIEEKLSARERATVTELDICVFRPAAFTALAHLLIGGNVCLYVPTDEADERARAIRLDQYVTRRDATGALLEAVILEEDDIQSLDPEVRAEVLKQDRFKDYDPTELKPTPVKIYTHIVLAETSDMFNVYQEAEGVRIPGSDGSFKKGELPWLFLRLIVQPGEHYGRSYVEEYLGDLDSLEALSETLVEGSAASAKVVFFVKPGGTTSLKVVAKAKNGDVVSGDPEDVGCLQVQKQSDLSVAKSQAEEIANRLAFAFLLHTSIQRKGERVTAEEIRYMAAELDDGLGGVYTLLAADFQLPSIRLFEKRMEKRTKAPKLPDNTVRPVIVSGLEAIGRGHDQSNLRAFLSDVVAILTPEVAMKYLNPSELLSRAAASYSIDTSGLIASQDEIAQREQMAQMQQLLSHLGPQALSAAGGMGKEIVKGAMTPPAQGTVPNG